VSNRSNYGYNNTQQQWSWSLSWSDADAVAVAGAGNCSSYKQKGSGCFWLLLYFALIAVAFMRCFYGNLNACQIAFHTHACASYASLPSCPPVAPFWPPFALWPAPTKISVVILITVACRRAKTILQGRDADRDRYTNIYLAWGSERDAQRKRNRFVAIAKKGQTHKGNGKRCWPKTLRLIHNSHKAKSTSNASFDFRQGVASCEHITCPFVVVLVVIFIVAVVVVVVSRRYNVPQMLAGHKTMRRRQFQFYTHIVATGAK